MDELDALYDAAVAGDADAIAKLKVEADKLNEDDETILHTESGEGNINRVRFILREFANKNLLTKLTIYKHTALHFAIYEGHTEVAEFLIDEARRQLSETSFQDFLRQGDKDMDTALHAAVKKGNVAIVKLLVEADPTDRHIPNNKGNTPMYKAVEKAYKDIVEIISTTCSAPSLDGPDCSMAAPIKDLDQAKSPSGTLYKIMDKDAIYAAAFAGDSDAIARLERQADTLNKYGQTILHIESTIGNTDHVRVILKVVASKNLLFKLDNQEETALTLAAYNGHTDVVEVLIDAARHLPPSATEVTLNNPITSFQDFLRHADKDSETALHAAVKQGHVASAKLLLEADPSHRHSQNKKGKTPFYIAVEKGYTDIVKVMCTSCTAPSLDGPGGSTALHAAIWRFDYHTELVNLIIGAARNLPPSYDDNSVTPFQAFVRQGDQDLNTALHIAVMQCKLANVKLLVEADPGNRHTKNNEGKTPIYIAAEKGYYYIVKMICTASIVPPNFDGPGDTTALHVAIKNLDKETVLTILDYNEELVTFADNLGWTVLHHAAYHEFDTIIETIIEAQKKQGHKFVYEDGVLTPFHVAAEKGYTSTVILLMKLWPSLSSPYTAVDKKRQNILHLAALQGKKEMIHGILKYCPEEYKKEFLNQQDINGNTPLHILIRNGCFVPELIRYEGLDITLENNEKWTPPDMLFYENQKIIEDQVQIKIALDHIQNDEKREIFSSAVLSSKRERKNVILNKQAQLMIHKKYGQIKEDSHAIAKCFADAIAGDAISKVALEMKADTLNEVGETILHVESMRGDTERVWYIVREFANKNLLVKLDRSKQTALHLAAQHGHTQVVKVLIGAARRNLTSSSANDDTLNPVSCFQAFIRLATVPMRNTALHLAVLNGNVATVKLLVEADPNDSHVQNNEGKTPIYIAAEKGYRDIVKEMCSTCTVLSLDGPGSRMTALHALIRNKGQVTESAISDMIRMIIHAAKRWSSADDPSLVNFGTLFSRTDQSGSTVLQMAMKNSYVEAVKLILSEDPAYQHGGAIKRNIDLMLLIYKAMDNKYSYDIIQLLSKAYQAGIMNPHHKDVLALILAMKERDEDSVLCLLEDVKNLVTFTDDNGWTPLHYAVYHDFDLILDVIVEAQEDVGYPFVFGNMVSTPFHIAAKHGYTSTLLRLLQLWPIPPSRFTAANSPYTVLDNDGRNILHLAAADNRKEIVEGIFKYCPEQYKDKILKQQDTNGDTPLHLLISHGCFVPELIKHKGLDTKARNKNKFTPRDMLYIQKDVVGDQVHIKIALDHHVQSNPLVWNRWAKSTEKKTNIWKSIVPPSKRRIKDVIFDERKQLLMDAKQEQRIKKDLQIFQRRTNTQIIVTALITTVTFTAGFTMPGGLRQSGGAHEGMVVLNRKAAFTAFMVSDALALLLSTCSLFLYFLETMYEDHQQVSKIDAASVGLNIVSVTAMMLTFITGTYLVLSDSPALAISVCIIGSFFFIFVIVLLIRLVYDKVKRNKD